MLLVLTAAAYRPTVTTTATKAVKGSCAPYPYIERIFVLLPPLLAGGRVSELLLLLNMGVAAAVVAAAAVAVPPYNPFAERRGAIK